MPEDVGGPTGLPWRVDERGSFYLGRCLTCDFRSPARRARFSVEADMRLHEIAAHPDSEVVSEAVSAGPGAPLGTGPLVAAEFGTRGYRGPALDQG